MKAFFYSLIKSAVLLAAITIICGITYTGIVTGIAQLFFNNKANGSLIEIDGTKYGSQLLAQYYQDEKHMWGRMMVINTAAFAGTDGTALLYSFPTNANTTSQDYTRCLGNRVKRIKAFHPEMGDTKIPVDLVTCSASGLDPGISLAAAEYQVQRLARANHITDDKVQSIIDSCTTHKVLGVFGEDTVNVLKVNLMLDGMLN